MQGHPYHVPKLDSKLIKTNNKIKQPMHKVHLMNDLIHVSYLAQLVIKGNIYI